MNNTIDGSKIVSETLGRLETEDGRIFYWRDDSYRVEPGTPLVEDGEWVEDYV